MHPCAVISIKVLVQTFSVSERVGSQPLYVVRPIYAGAVLVAKGRKMKELSPLKELDSSCKTAALHCC